MALKTITNLGYTTQDDVWGYLTNKELAKHDLLMTFNIDSGECDWDPRLGTSVRRKIFDKKTEANKDEIIAEIERIFNEDLRFDLVSLEIGDVEKGWIFYCRVSYLGGTPEEWIFSVNRNGIASVGNYPLQEKSYDTKFI